MKTKKTNSVKPTVKRSLVNTSKDTCSWSIYVYWFIILFFIAATFYILGRSQEILHPSIVNNVVTEETLLQSADYISSAKAKLSAGNIEDSIADLTISIESKATSDAYALRGEAYMQIGEYQKSLDDFELAIELDSENAIAYYDRALLRMRLEDYTSALNDINNALNAQTTKPSESLSMRNLYAKRGQLNLWLKNWQGAIADYTNSLARADGTVDPNVYAERAEAYTALGEYENAVNDYNSAIRVISELIQGSTTQESSETQASNAMIYFEKSAALNIKLGKTDVAKTDLESAYIIATKLVDEESVIRIERLLSDL
ncbi:MAG: tetratricopeptide repeat protein [Alphaproteobacteria bacterium]|nr:tetratricopeptide repeat protein [Alphaproteobacteria bacterium]